MNILMQCYHGSRLYGLHNENSDTDYKYVYLPTVRECILGTYKPVIEISKNGQNTANDVDKTYYALQTFINMALAGSPTAIEMLHANSENGALLKTSNTWENIRIRKHLFYTNNISNMMEFANSQAKRYGSRITNYKELVELQTLLREIVEAEPKVRIHKVVDKLPTGSIASFENRTINGKECKFYCVLDKDYETNIFVSMMLKSVEGIVKRYGKRVQQGNETNADWKSVSHAARALCQMIEILRFGEFNYPLKETETLMKIKLGLYQPEQVADIMDNLIAKTEQLMKSHCLPQEPDREYWESFVVNAFFENY